MAINNLKSLDEALELGVVKERGKGLVALQLALMRRVGGEGALDLFQRRRLVAPAQAFDSLQVLIEPFEDRFHGFICPLPIHVEVYAVS
jgi:hypothetical protein